MSTGQLILLGVGAWWLLNQSRRQQGGFGQAGGALGGLGDAFGGGGGSKPGGERSARDKAGLALGVIGGVASGLGQSLRAFGEA